ncbi:MAG: WD40 repeat domain-containing protein, partial [Blastochloris sp.]|nr:WD40 repeat domain-containing protein [Blastochloris sp.]
MKLYGRSRVWILQLLVALILMVFSPFMIADGPAERMKFGQSCRESLVLNEFSKLEELGNVLRTQKERFPEGLWKLRMFYVGLTPEKTPQGTSFEELEAKLAEWGRIHPNSLTVPVARARLYIHLAWGARGSGYANTVDAKGWKLFKEHIQQAREILERSKNKGKPCPEWYASMMTVALAQNWSTQDYDKLFQEAIGYEPGYYDYYFSRAYALLPRWHGEKGDWEDFAEQSPNFLPEEGMAIYARVAWAQREFYGNLFEETKIQWPKMRQGFRDLIKQRPDSFWNLKNFAEFAFMAGDRETAEELEVLMEKHPGRKLWENDPKLAQVKAWLGNRMQTKEKWSRQLPRRGGINHHFSISPDETVIAALTEDCSRVQIISKNTGKLLVEPVVGIEELTGLAYSPDGRFLAVAGGKTKGKVVVLDTRHFKVKGTIDEWEGGAFDLIFSSDSQKLYAVGGVEGKKAEAWELDLKTGKVGKPWDANHNHHLFFVLRSRDGKSLVVNCNGDIQVISLVTGQDFPKKRKPLRGHIQDGVFLPDGATFISTGGYWPDRGGYLDVWNTGTWESSILKRNHGRSRCLDLSPDGKWLAVGSDDGGV